MNIDLNKVLVAPTTYKGKVKLPKEYYENTDIVDIGDVDLSFEIKELPSQDLELSMHSKGVLVLIDSHTGENVDYNYEFSFNDKIDDENEYIGEFYIKDENTLDILGVLWENIVLEIPISYSKSQTLDIKGSNGWQLVGNKDNEIDPRLAPLQELLGQEEKE